MFDISGVSVAIAGESVCGDAWTLNIERDGFSALIADGLGHGHFAAQAASAAIAAAALGTSRTGCAKRLEVVHDGLRHTRGAAAAIVEVALPRGLVTFAGVGNIGAAIVDNGSDPSGGVAQRHARPRARGCSANTPTPGSRSRSW